MPKHNYEEARRCFNFKHNQREMLRIMSGQSQYTRALVENLIENACKFWFEQGAKRQGAQSEDFDMLYNLQKREII